MTRGFLRSVCRVLIGVVLTAQMAVSAYACPGLATTTAMPTPPVASVSGEQKAVVDRAAVQQAVDCADMMAAMDPSFANLCAEHCHQGQQSDHAATLTVPAALLTALYITPPGLRACCGAAPCGRRGECIGRGDSAAGHPALLFPNLISQTALR